MTLSMFIPWSVSTYTLHGINNTWFVYQFFFLEPDFDLAFELASAFSSAFWCLSNCARFTFTIIWVMLYNEKP